MEKERFTKTGNNRVLNVMMSILSLLGGSFCANAQIHDHQKFRQYCSMEDPTVSGYKWNFGAQQYMWLVHGNYSGAYNGVANPKFSELRSNVGRNSTDRAIHLVVHNVTLDAMRSENDSIKPIFIEEMALEADRAVDLVYPLYSDSFKELQAKIGKNLAYCLEHGGIKEISAVSDYAEENEMLVENVNYIHAQLPGNELENTKRQIAYEEIICQMEDLEKRTRNFAFATSVKTLKK